MKTILITGASSGLGKATAKLFAGKGWIVIATMRNPENETELSKTANVHLLKLDIGDSNQIANAIEKAMHISPVDVLFNNAGYVLMGPMEAMSDKQIVQQINVNLLGTIRITNGFLPYFRERKSGIIITTTSLGAYTPEPFMALYKATKAALESWTEGMSMELDKVGVVIKTIIPSFMNTSFVDNAQIVMHPAYEKWINKVLGVYTRPETTASADTPETIAEVVFEAASDDKKQMHYFAGNDANERYGWLQKEGIETVKSEMEKYFFE
ncbi:SDR family oxidoreductase [Flavobacterium pectinovorum]|uniref:SDR family oxidoreductase n=1 Tax=Flavobacterium pectinovorum TaxID=29533 RepID=UPI00265E3623|nr:SDR family oxidoreductase [Flavobacterium pectinovorum]WKL49140.1 SDR family oxidoreductase [Flavobacterium pectinovorum]